MSAIEIYRFLKKFYNLGSNKGAYYLKRMIYILYKCYIPYTAEIEEGTTLGYGGIGVVIHSNAVIGKNLKIGQGVTIGSRGFNPIIGDNVYILPGAKCLTKEIGSNVIIGANSVVVKDIPSNCVVVGVPARVISKDISKYSSYFKK